MRKQIDNGRHTKKKINKIKNKSTAQMSKTDGNGNDDVELLVIPTISTCKKQLPKH